MEPRFASRSSRSIVSPFTIRSKTARLDTAEAYPILAPGLAKHLVELLVGYDPHDVVRWERLVPHELRQAVVRFGEAGGLVKRLLHVNDLLANLADVVHCPLGPQYAVALLYHPFKALRNVKDGKGDEQAMAGSRKIGLVMGKPNKKEDLVSMKELFEAGNVKPVIDRCYPLSKVPEAFRYLEEGHAQGKLVITVVG